MFGTRTGPLARAPSLAGSLRKGTTIVHGWDGKGWKRRFPQQVPLPCQWKHSSGAANSPLLLPSWGWHHGLYSAWGRGQTFDVPALVLPARASLHTSLCCFFHSFLPPTFPFFSFAWLHPNVGKMEKCPFPPPAWYNPTPPAPLLPLQSSKAAAWRAGRIPEHPSSSFSSSSQLTSDGRDSPARLARRCSLPAGSQPPARVFHERGHTGWKQGCSWLRNVVSIIAGASRPCARWRGFLRPPHPLQIILAPSKDWAGRGKR